MVNQFEFIRVDKFLDDINREDCFDTQDMDGISPNFKFILVSECATDIEDCIDEDGTLRTPFNENTGVTIIDTDGAEDGVCSLLWGKGVNGERTISVADSVVTYDLGENKEYIKGIFLCALAQGTGYVLAYCILDKTIEVDGTLIMPVDGMLWSIRYGY